MSKAAELLDSKEECVICGDEAKHFPISSSNFYGAYEGGYCCTDYACDDDCEYKEGEEE